MNKILVTGSSGFIGRYVIDNLLDRGYKVIAFDRSKEADYPEGVDIFLGDVRDEVAVTEAVAKSGGVIHLAGVLGTAETVDNPTPAIDTNIVGSLNVFQAVRQYKKKCAYISVGNYWMNNSYSITKDTASRLAWMFNREHGTKIAVVRGLNAYGAGQKDRPVRKIMPNFVIPALKNEEITVYGDGSQVMDMIYVSDLADVMVRALVEEHDNYIYNPTMENQPPTFEAGSGRKTTVKEIAEMVISILESGKIKHEPMRAGEPEGSVVTGDPKTLKPLYGGSTPDLIPLEHGIKLTAKYYEEWLKNQHTKKD